MDATKFLEHQHREVEKLFKQLGAKKTTAAEKRDLVKELAHKLLAHMVVEQTIFYPAVFSADPDAIHEAYEEHHIARGQIMRALDADFSDDADDAKVKALQELIDHHVEEEEKELFPRVRKQVDDAKLNALGASMKAAFEDLAARRARTLFARAEAADVAADVDAATA